MKRNHRPDLLDDIVFFSAVVDTGSFREAGARLGRSGSAVSRAVARLEGRVGHRLLLRSARSVTMTPEGALLYPKAREALDQVRHALELLEGRTATCEGTTVIGAPLGMGRRVVVPTLPALRVAHPRLTIELQLSDRLHALDREMLDVAVRAGTLRDSRWKARALRRTHFIAVASPRWCAVHGRPKAAANVPPAQRLAYRGIDGRVRAWSGEEAALVVDDGDSVIQLAEQDAGVAFVLDVMVTSLEARGTLERLFEGPAGPTLWLLHRPSVEALPRVRVVIDHLVDALSSHDAEPPG